jgi:hypothetical protein
MSKIWYLHRVKHMPSDRPGRATWAGHLVLYRISPAPPPGCLCLRQVGGEGGGGGEGEICYRLITAVFLAMKKLGSAAHSEDN